MRKHVLFLILTLVTATTVFSQSRGVRIGYIDMEYILQNVPDYIEAKNQLELKAQKWKQEIEVKKNEISKLKEALKTEQVLLTKELIAERQEEINFQETELLNYQQKRFGPNGDLITQKAVLTQPIQDQVFTAAQDIAEAKKYDFIFDKSSDLTMLFAAKRYDISDQVVRAITRSSKREQLSKKELKEEAALEAKEDMIDENPNLAARQKALDDKKAAREKLVADRKLANEEKRKKLLADKEAKKNGTTAAKTEPTVTAEVKTETITEKTASGKTETETKKEVIITDTAAKKETDEAAIAKQKLADEKAAQLAERKKALEEKKKKILADREAAKKAKEEKAKAAKTATDTTKTN